MIVNYNDIQSHFENYLNEEKNNNNNNKYNMNKEINYRNKDYLSLSNIKSNSFNKKLFLSLNSSSNADSINNTEPVIKIKLFLISLSVYFFSFTGLLIELLLSSKILLFIEFEEEIGLLLVPILLKLYPQLGQ